MMELKAAALAAYKEQQEVDAERLAERVANEEAWAKKTVANAFGIEPDGVETIGKNTIVTAGGIALRYEAGGLNMWGVCPRCHELAIGQAIGGLESLGKALVEGFTPNYMHRCPADYEQPERAVTDAIGEYLENGIGLIDLATGHEGPATSQDAAALGQLYALIAIAIELKRANDRNDRLDDRQEAHL